MEKIAQIEVEKARDTNPYGYLNKPIKDRDLFSNIDSALHRNSLEKKVRENEQLLRVILESI